MVLEWPREHEEHGAGGEGALVGMKICITGTLTGMTRNQAHAAILNQGGEVTDNVTKSTTLLVVGEKPGSKVAKAEKNNIPIWDEERFAAVIGEMVPA